MTNIISFNQNCENMQQSTTSPTDHAAFKQMLKDMTIPELNEYMAIINNDIIKYVNSQGEHRPMSDTREYAEKLNIVAQEIKLRKQLRIEFAAA